MEHTCEQTCSDCMVRPSSKYTGPRIPCNLCNRHFRRQTCFDNHTRKTVVKRKSACWLRKFCGTCRTMITHNTHESKKWFCVTSYENKEVVHFCFMRLLVNLPASNERVLYVFYYFETTQDTKESHRTNEHVPNLVCLQQFCSKCENIPALEPDCI